jgi:hypothetical protein
MIPVQLAPEPPSFDEQVRQPGRAAMAKLVGGTKRREVLKPSDLPPLWRAAKDDLLAAYGRICAYACLYIHPTTGASTVDHFAPKSVSWDRVYEWDNYRLACGLINSRKGAYDDVIDPFEVEEGLFALDLDILKAVPGPRAGDREAVVQATIQRLGLDSSSYANELDHYLDFYRNGDISLKFLEKHAPLLARELRRQGRLNPGDG